MSSIDNFDPTWLRLELLRRVSRASQEAVNRAREVSEPAPAGSWKFEFPTSWRAVVTHLQHHARKTLDDVKMCVFLQFPKDSPFRNHDIERLYQQHCFQQWTPCFDWSSVAPLQMLLWDLAVNPSYRAPMVFHFYIAFVVLAVVHQAFFLACHGNLRHWRLSRGAVLCTLLIGRGVACLPPLLPGVGKSTEHLQAATSLAGLGMTNLLAVLALHMHTLDALILCTLQGIAGTVWSCFVLTLPFMDLCHTLLVSHTLVVCICIRVKYEQECAERLTFDQELLMNRGALLRTSDGLSRQCPTSDFNLGLRLLRQARCCDSLNF